MLEVATPLGAPDRKPPAGEQLALEYALEVLQGEVYENPVARLIHAPAGVYCELKHPFVAFYARLAPALAEVLGERDARRVVWEALARRQAREGDLLLVYDERTYYLAAGEETGKPRLEAPYLLLFEARRTRWLLFFQGKEFLFFRFSPGLPVLGGAVA